MSTLMQTLGMPYEADQLEWGQHVHHNVDWAAQPFEGLKGARSSEMSHGAGIYRDGTRPLLE